MIWRPLSHGRVLDILHNPEYAGVYVYGRTKTRLLCLPGEEPRVKGRTRRVRPEDWPFLIPGHHPGYITWDQFQRNQRRLDDNRTSPDEDHRGAPREGLALLQGIVRCGRCGRRMSVRYLKKASIPSYECNSVPYSLSRATPASRFVVMRSTQRSHVPSWKPCGRHSSRSRWPPSIRSPPRHVSSIANGN